MDDHNNRVEIRITDTAGKTRVYEGDLASMWQSGNVLLQGVSLEDVVSAVYHANGYDVVITLADGRVITIANFKLFDEDQVLEVMDGVFGLSEEAIATITASGLLGIAAWTSDSSTVDQTVAAPAAALNADTGADATDGLTNDGTVNVTLAADAASWEFSTDGGATWTAGTGTSFSLAEGAYAAGDVQVRQTDAAGNTSAAAELAAVEVVNIVSQSWSYPTSTTARAIEVATGDINGDGNTDMVAGRQSSSEEMYIYSGNGDGTFGTVNTVGNPVQTPGDLKLADIDGDGNLDLLAAVGSLEVSLGNGDGTFSAASPVASGALNELDVADLNGDGNLDVVATDTNADRVSLFTGNGDGTFNASVAIDDSFNAVRDITLQDFDGDGDVDVIAGGDGNGSGKAVFYANNGDGTFTTGVSIASGLDTTYTVASGDFDGDGHQDVLIGSDGRGGDVGLSLLLGNGDGSFSASTPISTNAQVKNIEVNDFNGDGLLDVAATSGENFESTLKLWLGNGDGTFQGALTVAEGGEFYSMGSDDFDGDGSPDLVAVDRSGATFDIYPLEVV